MKQTNHDHQIILLRVFLGLFGLAFLGIGLSFLLSMWFTTFNRVGFPSLFFRIIFTFVSLPFIVLGFSVFYRALTGMIPNYKQAIQKTLHSLHPHHHHHHQQQQSLQTLCPQCHAPIGRAEISPSGDVKCLHCHHWYNVSRSRD